MNQQTVTIESLSNLLEKSSKIITQQQHHIKLLEEKIDFLVRQKFTSSSEKFPDNHPSLFDEESVQIESVNDTEIEEIKVVRKKKGGRTTPPASLPHVRVEHDLQENEKVCSCGCDMKRIKEIVSHQYDVIPAKFQVIKNVRFVYACSCGCGSKVKTSKLTAQVLPRHQVTPSFLATIAVQKFEDSLPLERQAKIYKQRFGVSFTSSTFSNWIIKASKLRLEPLIGRLNEIQMQSDYIHADETTLQVLKEEDKKPQSKSYIWLKVSNDIHPIVLMHYSSNRAASTALTLFNGFTGYLQTDGYPGYNSVANKENVKQLGCWAHARRKFADIIKSTVSDQQSKQLSKEAVNYIAQLYKVEKEIKNDPPDLKKQIREEKSKPIIRHIYNWIDENFFTAQKLGGAIAKAFVYLNNQFEKLSIYLEDGKLSIDNNKAENHIRPIALGRKNWLFSTSTQGAHALSNWYSIIETAKANNIDPYKYLCYILKELPIYQVQNKDIDQLLPWNVSLS
jgi:transposase